MADRSPNRTPERPTQLWTRDEVVRYLMRHHILTNYTKDTWELVAAIFIGLEYVQFKSKFNRSELFNTNLAYFAL